MFEKSLQCRCMESGIAYADLKNWLPNFKIRTTTCIRIISVVCIICYMSFKKIGSKQALVYVAF